VSRTLYVPTDTVCAFGATTNGGKREEGREIVARSHPATFIRATVHSSEMRLRCGRNPIMAGRGGGKPVLDWGGPRAAAHHAAQARRGDKPRPDWRSRSSASGSRQARQGASMARTRGGVATAAPARDKARRRGLPMAGAGGGGRRCGAGTAGAKAAWRAGSKMQGWLRSGPDIRRKTRSVLRGEGVARAESPQKQGFGTKPQFRRAERTGRFSDEPICAGLAAKANLVVAEPLEDAQIGRIKSRGPLPRTKPSPYTQASLRETAAAKAMAVESGNGV